MLLRVRLSKIQRIIYLYTTNGKGVDVSPVAFVLLINDVKRSLRNLTVSLHYIYIYHRNRKTGRKRYGEGQVARNKNKSRLETRDFLFASRES